MWNFKRDIFRVENSINNSIYCYSININASSYNQDCLGNQVQVNYETLTLTLRDINGNPVIATEDYIFYLTFREKTCLTSETDAQLQYTVIAGNSSVSGTYSTQTYVDCGQGTCELEYQQYIAVSSTPLELPSIIDCTPPVCNSYTASTSSSSIEVILYTDCSGVQQEVRIGAVGGYDEISFCSLEITSTTAGVAIVLNGGCAPTL